MSFLAPLFLAGLALIAGPIIFHLIKQAPRNRIVFSSTELLDPSEPKTERSRRIQNPWLLLIRCLIVALLAFAFARPFFPNSAPPASGDSIHRDVVVAVDRSASMKRAGISNQVEASLTEILESLGQGDSLTLLAFSDVCETIVSSEQWRNWPRKEAATLAVEALKQSPTTDRPGHLDRAVRTAISEGEALRESSEAEGIVEIYLISDFASGASISGLAGLEWPSEMTFDRIEVTPAVTAPNVGIRWLGWDVSSNEEGRVARLSVVNSNPSVRTAVTLQAYEPPDNQPIGEPLQITLENGAEQTVAYPIPEPKATRPIRFTLTGDEQSFDNQLYVAPEYVPEIEVALLSESDTSNPNEAPYFLEKAFTGFKSPSVNLVHNQAISSGASLHIVDRPLSQPEAATLRSAVSEGKTALVLASDSEVEATLNRLSSDTAWNVQAHSDNALLIGDVDFSHFLFQPFTDSRYSNFANIRTWNPLDISYSESSDIRPIASFDDGSPALLETRIGEGNLFIWSSSWAPRDSQWILSTKFIPFLHRLSLLASGGPTPSSNAVFNEESSLAYRRLLDGQELEGIGVYEVAANRWIAFQLSPEESKTAPITTDTWDRLGLPETGDAYRKQQISRLEASQIRESAIAAEQRQQIWKWALWVALGLLMLESAIAIFENKRREVAPT